MARPLDGGALTRWGARSPARGPAMAPSRLLASLVSLGLAAQLREKGEEKWGLGFSTARRGGGFFYQAKRPDGRRI